MADKKTLPGLSERLQLILSELQLRQTDFARSLGISANYVYLLTSGRKRGISEPLARLIESTYGYRAAWLLTGEGDRLASAPRENLKRVMINRIKLMSPQELQAVAAFIRSLDEHED